MTHGHCLDWNINHVISLWKLINGFSMTWPKTQSEIGVNFVIKAPLVDAFNNPYCCCECWSLEQALCLVFQVRVRFIIRFMTSFNKALVVICPPYIVRSMDSQGNVIIISNQTDQALNVALPTVIIQSAHRKSFHIFVHHCFYCWIFYSLFANHFIIDFSMELPCTKGNTFCSN